MKTRPPILLYFWKGEKMENKKLIEDQLDDCNSVDTHADHIGLAPEMEQFRTHSIYINGRILEAVDVLEGEE